MVAPASLTVPYANIRNGTDCCTATAPFSGLGGFGANSICRPMPMPVMMMADSTVAMTVAAVPVMLA